VGIGTSLENHVMLDKPYRNISRHPVFCIMALDTSLYVRTVRKLLIVQEEENIQRVVQVCNINTRISGQESYVMSMRGKDVIRQIL
jgi:hypothetical protein